MKDNSNTCIICLNKFFPRRRIDKYCSLNCRKISSKLAYHKSKKLKICIICNSEFFGKKQQKNCKNCTRKRLQKIPTKPKDVHCPKCGKIVDIQIKINIFKNKIKGKVCDECKVISKKSLSDRMKSDKNPSIVKFGRDNKKKMTKEECGLFLSEKLKNNNPMKKEETRKKVSNTLKINWKNGKYKKKFGKDHWAWKGNRLRSKTIRTRLYKEWSFPILQRDNFACTICGISKRKLEVHHKNPTFVEILEEALCGRILENLTVDEFEKLILDIIDIHKQKAYGITVCVKCHMDIDPKRRLNVSKKDQ